MAYAAIISLKKTLEMLLDSSRSRVPIPNSDLNLIHDNLCYLKSFFDEVVSLEDSNSIEKLEEPVKMLLQTTQDLIESHVSDVFHAGSDRSGTESSISGFSRDLMERKEELGSLTEMFKAMDLSRPKDQKSMGRFAADVDVASRIDLGRNMKKVELTDIDASSRIGYGRNDIMVGFDDELIKLLDLVTGHSSPRTIISIVGMGGVGKTTLARYVYRHPLTNEHFDVLLWVSVGLEYELEDLLLCLFQVAPQVGEKLTDELGEILFKHLRGRRYLIVFDDVWDTRFWEEVQLFLPDNANGSRIIFTSRLADVARSVSSEGNILQQRFLGYDESWELLQRMAFLDMECPSQLIEIGKKIAGSLGGLPLAIVMIGGLLSKSGTSVETWRAVAEDIESPIWETTIPKFMKLSYTQLPQHLKACFLYLGLFPPNYNIPAAQLIKLWVAEGFIEPSAADESLEQKAQEYLEDLVSRSLVIVQERNFRGKIKTCRLHSLIGDLCVSEAQQENLFHIVKEGGNTSPQGGNNQRRLGIHSHPLLVSKLMKSVSAARSLVIVCPRDQHNQLKMYPRFRYLRVLHGLSLCFRKFPDEVLKLVGLRYLAITYDGKLPSSISMLWKLEVLVVHRSRTMNSTVSLPSEVWKLRKLRHLEYMGCYLPDPATATGDGGLEKLLTLSGVCAHSITQAVIARMPNLIKLGVWFGPSCGCTIEFSNILTNLDRLGSFKWAVMNRDLRPEAAVSYHMNLPDGLAKISLSGCRLPWEDMSSIGALPNLQVLKLRWSAFCGPRWEPIEGQFLLLKLLLLEDLDVEVLIADSSHFPRLQKLLVRHCYILREIPSALGDIPTLEMIEVNDCSISVAVSARRIEEEQEELGNDDLQVQIS